MVTYWFTEYIRFNVPYLHVGSRSLFMIRFGITIQSEKLDLLGDK